jgi:hypothetical protein
MYRIKEYIKREFTDSFPDGSCDFKNRIVFKPQIKTFFGWYNIIGWLNIFSDSPLSYRYSIEEAKEDIRKHKEPKMKNHKKKHCIYYFLD